MLTDRELARGGGIGAMVWFGLNSVASGLLYATEGNWPMSAFHAIGVLMACYVGRSIWRVTR
jgi:hypothetical protein